MKKKMNFLCFMVFVVLILSMSEGIYSFWTGVSTGAKAGYEQSKEKALTGKTIDPIINHLKPLCVHPISLFETQDSIYNEKTQSYIPIWYSQAAIGLKTDTPLALVIFNSLGALFMVISFIYSIVQFIKLIRDINRYEIFCWKNVRRLRKIGFSLLLLFTIQFTTSYLFNMELAQHLVLSNYTLNWIQPFSDNTLLLGIVSLVFAEIFSVGLKIKEDQDLTI